MTKIDSPQDLLFVDGRLTTADLDVMQTKNFAKCIFVFDDTEGVEKGVEETEDFKYMPGKCQFFHRMRAFVSRDPEWNITRQASPMRIHRTLLV